MFRKFSKCPNITRKSYTVETYKSLQSKSLFFAIFWEIFENCQLKTLLNSKKFKLLRFFEKKNSVTIYTSRL